MYKALSKYMKHHGGYHGSITSQRGAFRNGKLKSSTPAEFEMNALSLVRIHEVTVQRGGVCRLRQGELITLEEYRVVLRKRLEQALQEEHAALSSRIRLIGKILSQDTARARKTTSRQRRPCETEVPTAKNAEPVAPFNPMKILARQRQR